MSTIGEEIRRLRLARGLTLAAVAKQLRVSVSYLSDVELGRRGALARLYSLAEVLGVSEKHFERFGLRTCKHCGDSHECEVKR